VLHPSLEVTQKRCVTLLAGVGVRPTQEMEIVLRLQQRATVLVRIAPSMRNWIVRARTRTVGLVRVRFIRVPGVNFREMKAHVWRLLIPCVCQVMVHGLRRVVRPPPLKIPMSYQTPSKRVTLQICVGVITKFVLVETRVMGNVLTTPDEIAYMSIHVHCVLLTLLMGVNGVLSTPVLAIVCQLATANAA
jgi:hypothetical protein